MKLSAAIGIGITSFYHVIIGTVGYAAFGNDVPGNLLTGFGYFEPWWLIMLANLAIVVSKLEIARSCKQLLVGFTQQTSNFQKGTLMV